MVNRVHAKISKSALIHNFHVVKSIAPNSKVIAMVKANAYGHGLIEVAKVLNAADAFGVADLKEALLLREAGIQNDIVLMEGFFNPNALDEIVTHNLTTVIHHIEQVNALKVWCQDTKLPIWIKINTGMNRLGFNQQGFIKANNILQSLPNVRIIGYMTHFSNADEINNPKTQDQANYFFEWIEGCQGARSLANSAGILGWPSTHQDWIRPGLMLYGASPLPGRTAESLNLKPAMRLTAELIAIQEVTKGQQVGYGGIWRADQDNAKIGIVSIGYGDGYPWHAQSGTPVLVNNQLCTIVGRVSMDMLAVDLSELRQVKVGDPVLLWGEDLPIEEVALGSNTVPYELFCRLTDRVTVEIVD